MLKIFITALLFLSGSGLYAQGISFFHGSWGEALEEAKKDDRIIFVDAYAKWCGPCKRMAREVFTQEEVGDFFNNNFINLKLDMEEPAGFEFGKNYPVTAFPTLFFLDSEGNILQKSVGGKQAGDLIELARMAIRAYDRSDEYAERYEAGERDFELVLNYISELNKVGKPSLKISNEYLNDDPDITKKQKALFLLEAVVEADSKLYDQLITLKKEAIRQSSEELFTAKVAAAAMKTVEKAVDFDYAPLLDEAIAQFDAADTGDKKQFEYEARLYYNALRGQYEDWKELSQKFLKKYGKKNADLYREHLTQIARYFDFVDEAKAYNFELADKLVKIESTADNYLFYLRLLMNERRFDKAYEIAREALKKFEDDPLSDQFKQMEKYLEKQKTN